MAIRFLMSLFAISLSLVSFSQDTLFFKLSNPWNTVKDQNGKYLRKCVKENDYFHIWDYNSQNKLVTESFYSDTNFTRKLFCHKYYDEKGGHLEQSRCYENGRLHGYFVSYSPKGDTLGYDIYQNGEVVSSGGSYLERVDAPFVKNEKSASFPGGTKSWEKYLSENIIHPDSLQNVHGEVTLRFKLDKEGVVEKIELLKSLHPILDQEAIKVIKNSPKWKPAKQNGKFVKSIITQTINF